MFVIPPIRWVFQVSWVRVAGCWCACAVFFPFFFCVVVFVCVRVEECSRKQQQNGTVEFLAFCGWCYPIFTVAFACHQRNFTFFHGVVKKLPVIWCWCQTILTAYLAVHPPFYAEMSTYFGVYIPTSKAGCFEGSVSQCIGSIAAVNIKPSNPASGSASVASGSPSGSAASVQTGNADDGSAATKYEDPDYPRKYERDEASVGICVCFAFQLFAACCYCDTL